MSNAVLERALTAKGSETPKAELVRLPGELRLATERLEVARQAVAESVTMPARLRQVWQALIRLPAEELHLNRDVVRAKFDEWLEMAAMTAEVLPHAIALAGGTLKGADQVPIARQELARFVEMILSRWKTLDDLCELIVDTIELPEWVTKGTTPAHLRPPQWWIDDLDDDPLKPPADAS